MWTGLSRLAFERRWHIIAAAVALVAVALLWGVGVFGRLTDGGFDDPASASSRATRLADTHGLPRDGADLVVLFSSATQVVDDPAYRAAVASKLSSLPPSRAIQVTSYWTSGARSLVSANRHSTFAVVQLAGATDSDRQANLAAMKSDLERPVDGLRIQLGGQAAVGTDVGNQVEADVQHAEVLSAPVLLVLLVVVFGGLVAASLPLLIGALAVLGSMTALRVITLFTDVSIFSINIVTMLGIGLAVDYSLFVVSRFREEMRAGADVEQALETTMRTAGRTIAFSAVTVAIALGSLFLFPQLFLRSMAFGGIAAVLIALLASLTVLPAILAALGPRVDRLRIGRARPSAARHGYPRPGLWARTAQTVMRRPVVFVAVLVPVLLLLGAPFLGVRFGGVDYRVLPAATQSRIVTEQIARDFRTPNQDPVEVVVDFSGPPASVANGQRLNSYRTALASLPGVVATQVTGTSGDVARVSVYSDNPTESDAARTLVKRVRALPAPAGAAVLVGGPTAQLVDQLASLGQRLPWMAAFMILTTLALLFAAFGSFVLPVKAVLMNVLSLGAAFGAIVWIFQDGHASGLLDFTVTGTVDSSQPILMLAIAFGLSMDYQMFLLSRIREQWDRTHDNTAAVAGGLQRTGWIISSAAMLLSVVFAAFATSGITFIKMIGVGMVVAILVDATVVRGLLVPATMRLLGTANWWAPPRFASWWQRHGLRESDDEGPESWAPAHAMAEVAAEQE